MEIRQVDSYCEGGGVWVWNNSIPVGSAIFHADDWKTEFHAWLKKELPHLAEAVDAGKATFEEDDLIIELRGLRPLWAEAST